MNHVRTTSLASEGSPRGSVFRGFVRTARRITGRKSLRKDESGVAAVEFALVLPVLATLMTGILDFGFLFFVQHNMVTAARESARALAVQSVTEVQAEQMAHDKLDGWASFDVVATEPGPANPADVDVVVTITVSMQDAAPIGFIFDMIGGFSGDLNAQVFMRQEV